MIVVRYAVCSEAERKPVTRAVVETRPDAERLLESLRQKDGNDPSVQYWVAEIGPECDQWRFLGTPGKEGS
ncbi:MAG: hypothetical protein HY903_17920 [Deltaproteobacteria bacterium]|nr:hypothetical protein [Deltaproteobacteria bacterium]